MLHAWHAPSLCGAPSATDCDAGLALALLPCPALRPPLVYQTTTSLGLAQVQPRSPKVVVATGAAARALKNGNFFTKNKVLVANQVRAYSSSFASPPCSAYQIWYWPGGCSNEHVRALASTTVTKGELRLYPYHTNTNMEKAF